MFHEEAVISLMVLVGVVGCSGTTSIDTARRVDVGAGGTSGTGGGTSNAGSGGIEVTVCHCTIGDCPAGSRAVPANEPGCPPCNICQPCGPVNCPNVPACGLGQQPITPPGECCPTSCGTAGSGGAGAGGAGTGGSGGSPAPATDAGNAPPDAGQAMCVPPPNLPPTSTTCTNLPYNPQADSYIIWIADSSAPGGGQTVTLAANQAVTIGGRTYKNTGAGLVGGGAHGIYGDASFDVDGVANALSFHFEGCAAPVSTGTWELIAAVTRKGPFCTSCPESITRRYMIRRTGSGSTERYTFDAEGPPQACELGADLLEIVLH